MAMRDGQTMTPGNRIETLGRAGEKLAGDSRVATGTRLERVLVRGGNARLAMVFANLAGELAPTASRCRDLPATALFTRAA